MSDEPRTPRDQTPDAEPRRRDHLRVVEPLAADTRALPLGGLATATAPAVRPRTIGRLIAQTALIADSAVTRRQLDDTMPQRGVAGRLLGRFR